MLTKVLPDLEAARALRAALLQTQVPQPRRPHLGGSSSGPGPACTDATRSPGCSSRLGRVTVQGDPAQGDPEAGLGAGDAAMDTRTISGLRVSDSSARCPGTSESHGDRDQVQSRSQR